MSRVGLRRVTIQSEWRVSAARPPNRFVEIHINGSASAGGCDSLRRLTRRIEIKTWLAENPRIHVHFTPTSASWMNLVESCSGSSNGRRIHRGPFTFVSELIGKIRGFINGWNDRSHPFVWTKTAEQILKKANRKTTSITDH
jgi:hypothetical protein